MNNFRSLLFLFFYQVFFGILPIACERANPFYLACEIMSDKERPKVIFLSTIVVVNGIRGALLNDGAQTQIAYVNDTVWGYKVKQIGNDSIILEKDGVNTVVQM